MNFDDFNDSFDTDLDHDFDVEENKSFESGFEIELTNVRQRMAILTKRDMIALLGVQTFDHGGTLCRVDPREARPAVQLYDNPEEALQWFKRSLRTSKKNGWQVVYDGLPLHG